MQVPSTSLRKRACILLGKPFFTIRRPFGYVLRHASHVLSIFPLPLMALSGYRLPPPGHSFPPPSMHFQWNLLPSSAGPFSLFCIFLMNSLKIHCDYLFTPSEIRCLLRMTCVPEAHSANTRKTATRAPENRLRIHLKPDVANPGATLLVHLQNFLAVLLKARCRIYSQNNMRIPLERTLRAPPE